MARDGFVIRQMERDDVELAVDWAAGEGWNPGLNDASCFYITDPQGFFIGEIDGRPIGCISAVSYGEHYGFIGFYIIRKELRGRWFGVELGRRAMKYLGNRNIGIDGVVEKIKNYEKFGFTLAHRNIRYEGKGGGSGHDKAGIVDLSTVSFEMVNSYDAAIFPARRDTFLKNWIVQAGSISLGFLKGGVVKGYGVMRPCRIGFKIGPLFADSADIARRLFSAMRGKVSMQTSIFFDIPDISPAARALAEDHAMKPVFETGRMYTGKMPAVPWEKIFGITSFELG